MKKILQFLRNWTLPVAMITGVILYFAFNATPLSDEAKNETYHIISHFIQPVLIFSMLFLAFTKVDPHDMRPHKWHAWLLLCQTAMFIIFSLLAIGITSPSFSSLTDGISHDSIYGTKILLEGAMLCFICPTATAAAVITGKLGGSLSGVTTYLMICNLMVSLVAPAFLTSVEPNSGLDFLGSFFMIMGKVFPLLICPLITAWIVRLLLPQLHHKIVSITGIAFYIWAVALSFAILVTVRSIMNSTVSIWYMIGLALISFICCVFQFVVGKRIGSHYDGVGERMNRITAGQAFGQKNTVFIIWLGLVFLDPITSTVGGFYSIWHNIINSYQLYKVRKMNANKE